MPIYKVKWCCIVLNAFLPAESERRRFAGVPLDGAFFGKTGARCVDLPRSQSNERYEG